MTKLHVAFDLDGVLYKWDEAAAEALEGKFGYANLVRESETWDHLVEQVEKAHWMWLFTPEGGEATLNSLHMYYPSAPDTLQRVGKIATVTFITHRPPGAAACTARWLASMNCHFTSLHVVGAHDGVHTDKSSVQPQADVYVEDREANVMDLLNNTRGIVFAPRLKHNAALHTLEDERLVIYDDISEVADWVERIVSL